MHQWHAQTTSNFRSTQSEWTIHHPFPFELTIILIPRMNTLSLSPSLTLSFSSCIALPNLMNFIIFLTHFHWLWMISVLCTINFEENWWHHGKRQRTPWASERSRCIVQWSTGIVGLLPGKETKCSKRRLRVSRFKQIQKNGEKDSWTWYILVPLFLHQSH